MSSQLGSSSSSRSSSSGAMDSSSTGLSSTEAGSDTSAEGIVLFLSVCVLIGCVCRWVVKRFDRLPLPFTVLLLFVGVLMGALVGYEHKVDNAFQVAILAFSNLPPHLALYLFLPVLMFDSAFNVHFHLFMHSIWASLLLAFPGSVFALFSAALVVYYCFDYGWSFSQSLLLGSILAATDPVAVVSLMRDLGSNYALSALVEAESFLNDGAAYVVYLIVQSVMLEGSTDAATVTVSLLQYSIGGPAFGVLVGLGTVFVMDTLLHSDTEIEIALTIGVVYVTFFVADSVLEVSTVLALVCLGLVMSKNRYSISPSVQPSLQAVWSALVFIANILIFLLSGLIIADKLFFTQGVGWQDVGCVVLLYVVLHVARFLTIVAFLPLFNRTSMQLSWSEVLMVSWSGVRGGMSLLLAILTYLQTGYDLAYRSRLTFLVSGVALLTLVINCMSARYVLKWLRLDRGTEESSLVLQSALLHLRDVTEEVMDKLANKTRFKRVDWEAIEDYLPQRLIDEVLEETGQPPLPPSPPPTSSQPGDESEVAEERCADAPMRRRDWKDDDGKLQSYEEIDESDERRSQNGVEEGENDSDSSSGASGSSGCDGDSEHEMEGKKQDTTLLRSPPFRVHSFSLGASHSVGATAIQANDSNSNRSGETTALALAADEAELQSLVRPTTTVIDPPPGPSAPVAPHPPPFHSVSHSLVWDANPPFRVPRLRKHSRRFWPVNSSTRHAVIAPPIPHSRLQKELSVRYLTAMQADFARQFSSGLITRPALRLLNAAVEQGFSGASVLSCWSKLQQQMQCPRWLSYARSSPQLLSDEWYTRPLVPLVHSLLFRHVKLSVELAMAVVSANQRLEAMLHSFPEVSLINVSVVITVQQLVEQVQQEALEQWIAISEGYGEAHSAVVTRHAAIMLLHFQQREIRSLHATGMLEQREFDLIIALIVAKLVRLDQRGLRMHMSTAVELLQQHPLMLAITEEQRRRIRQWMRQRRTRQWHSTHQTVWDRGQHCPGLLLTVRGTFRVVYDYQDADSCDEDNELAVGKGAGGKAGATDPASGATTTNTNTGNSSLRWLDTKGRLSVVGSYEMLTGHSTLASCRSVTMAESFMLDRDCVELMMEEEDAMQRLIRSAAEDIIKHKWVQWGMAQHTDMKQYHMEQLVSRAHVFRAKAADREEVTVEVEQQPPAPKRDEEKEESNAEDKAADRAGDENVTGRTGDELSEIELMQSSQSQHEQSSAPLQSQPPLARTSSSSRPVSPRFASPSPPPSQPPPSSSQHRISLRYNEVLLIIDGSAVGEGMTRRVRRAKEKASQQKQKKQPAAHHTVTTATNAPLTAPLVDPLTRPRLQSSPLYLGPCMLRHRAGQLVMSANCIYVRWEVRDEEIASLFPPPPRADMRQYARDLGLQLRFSAMVGSSGEKLAQSPDSRPPLLSQPTFNSPTFASPLAVSSAGVPLLPSSATLPPVARLTSASVTSTLPPSAAGYSVNAAAAHPPERPLALSELPSPRLGHYLGASSMRTITASTLTLPSSTPQPQHIATTSQQQQRRRRHSLDATAEQQILSAAQRQRRASTEATGAAAHEQQHFGHGQRSGQGVEENDNEASNVRGEDEDEEEEEIEESEVEWDPSGPLAAGRALPSGGLVRQGTSRAFAFDFETANALTI